MGFRVADKSSFTIDIETDLPPSRRNIHPSGVLHVLHEAEDDSDRNVSREKSDLSSSGVCVDGFGLPMSELRRKRSIFVWIAHSIHVEFLITHLESRLGMRRQDVVFVPYSTKENWTRCHPRAQLDLECLSSADTAIPSLVSTSSGEKITLSLAPLLLAEAAAKKNDDVASAAYPLDCTKYFLNGKMKKSAMNASAEAESARDDRYFKNGKMKKGARDRWVKNYMLRDETLIPDAERDELHLEIWNYLSWLHGRLVDLDEADAAASARRAMEDDDDLAEDGGGKKKRGRGRTTNCHHGVDLPELKAVLDKLEDAFPVIPNARLELMGDDEKEEITSRPEEEGEHEWHQRQEEQRPQPAAQKKGAPFLEESLSSALTQLVSARELSGLKRRSRRKRRKVASGNTIGRDFDEFFRRLVQYKAEHGDCLVPRDYEDADLSNWTKGLREKRSKLQKSGVEMEEVPPGGKLHARTLNAERISKLDSIGFVWKIQTAIIVPWEDRFEEMLRYYNDHGKWPSQSGTGSLGCWVHKQRKAYSKKSPKFMRERVFKLDEVGFEWAPRGPRGKSRVDCDTETEGG